ncbi:hypothetical protein BD626DRAFT_638522 [Schizophyllum amplum]|uniref:CFEM domain-containing protein n=1 Tax=Schizophyllum amplum TaxID=97359 RepID=A0A550BRQ5_9AGAR|nr:hypothetical protein BD626DRAFT_638522 [Auriculariopsis ampla]
MIERELDGLRQRLVFPDTGLLPRTVVLNNCLLDSIGNAGCASVADVNCFCTSSSFFTGNYLDCLTNNCSADELDNAEGLAEEFCALAGPSTSLSFTGVSMSATSSSMATLSNGASSHSSTSSSTSTSASSSGLDERSNEQCCCRRRRADGLVRRDDALLQRAWCTWRSVHLAIGGTSLAMLGGVNITNGSYEPVPYTTILTHLSSPPVSSIVLAHTLACT